MSTSEKRKKRREKDKSKKVDSPPTSPSCSSSNTSDPDLPSFSPCSVPSSLALYLPGESLGKGAFGSVVKAMHAETGEFFALKQIDLERVPPELQNSVLQELHFLSTLNHPNIIKMYDSFQTEKELSLVLEYIENGSLERVIKKYGPLKENLLQRFMSQVLKGLEYLHEQEVMHLDIKAGNILVTKGGKVKLSDFGIAETFSSASTSDTSSTVLGSPYWMAPEVIDLEPATWSADIWSVACTIIELLTGDPPYFHLGKLQAVFAMVKEDHPPLPTGISTNLSSLLLTCFTRNEKERPSATTLLSHAFFESPPTTFIVTSSSSPSTSATSSPSPSPSHQKSKKRKDIPKPHSKTSLTRRLSDDTEEGAGKSKNRFHLTLIEHDIMRPGENIDDIDYNKLKQLLFKKATDLAKLQDKEKNFEKALKGARDRLSGAEMKQVEVQNEVSALQDEVFLLCTVMAKGTDMEPSRILKQVTGDTGQSISPPKRGHHSRSASDASAHQASSIVNEKDKPQTMTSTQTFLQPSESDKERYKWMMTSSAQDKKQEQQSTMKISVGPSEKPATPPPTHLTSPPPATTKISSPRTDRPLSSLSAR